MAKGTLVVLAILIVWFLFTRNAGGWGNWGLVPGANSGRSSGSATWSQKPSGGGGKPNRNEAY